MNSTPSGGNGRPHHSDPYNDEDAFDPTPYDYAPYQPYSQPYHVEQTRTPPPSGPPPAYYRVLNKTYSGNLRPIVLASCFISLCFLVLLSVQDFKVAASSDITSKYKTLTLVEGILFIAAACIEVFGLFATYAQRLQLAQTYSWLSLVAFGATIASQILAVVIVYTLKTDVLQNCSSYYQTAHTDNSGSFWDDDANNTPLTADQADKFCNSLWSRQRTWDIIWLFVTTLVGALFVMFSFAYARQLADPNSVRRKFNIAQQNQPPSSYNPNAYGNASGPYDPQGQYSYPPPPASANRMAYAPPADAPPKYNGRPSLDDADYNDIKSSGAMGEYGYDYGRDDHQYEYEHDVPAQNRPGSSRSVRSTGKGDDNEARRESGETLRGEASSIKAAAKPSLHSGTAHHDDAHDDGADLRDGPQI